jgi:uncharacterized protein YbaA (DUF1428 family)
MIYIDGFVAAVPAANQGAYLQHAEEFAAVVKEYGALRVVQAWGDDVPDGQVTSFPMAVKRGEGEVVVYAWVEWPSKAVRDAGWQRSQSDPRMGKAPTCFDGQRVIFGGFQLIQEK